MSDQDHTYAHPDCALSPSTVEAMKRIREMRDSGKATPEEIRSLASELETALSWCWEGNRDHNKATERERVLREELERTKKQFGSCSVCGYVAWKDRDASTEECQYCKLKTELRWVQGHAAQMRDFLLYLKPKIEKDGIPEEIESLEIVLSSDADKGWVSPEKHAKVQAACAEMGRLLKLCDDFFSNGATSPPRRGLIKAALSTDAGKGWASPEDAKVMVEALQKIMGSWSEVDMPYEARLAEIALDHARQKGLLR